MACFFKLVVSKSALGCYGEFPAVLALSSKFKVHVGYDHLNWMDVTGQISSNKLVTDPSIILITHIVCVPC